MTKNWQEGLMARVARSLKEAREAQKPKLSVAKLADRTSDIGYPMSRTVIADIELGRRRSLDVVELIVLAAALNIPPVLLLYPEAPDGEVEVLPGVSASSDDAIAWFSGESLRPGRVSSEGVFEVPPHSEGVELLKAIRERRDTHPFGLSALRLIHRENPEDLPRDVAETLVIADRRRAKLNAEIERLGGTVRDE